MNNKKQAAPQLKKNKDISKRNWITITDIAKSFAINYQNNTVISVKKQDLENQPPYPLYFFYNKKK